MATIRHLNLRSSCIGIEKRHNSKLNCHYAYIEAEYSNRKIRIFFCKRGRKGTWNAFLSTNTGLNFFEAYRIYSMRWAIEVCFSEMKGLLKLGESQCRNFSSQIASVSLTVMQYNILSFIKRFEAYETIGGCSTKPSTEQWNCP